LAGLAQESHKVRAYHVGHVQNQFFQLRHVVQTRSQQRQAAGWQVTVHEIDGNGRIAGCEYRYHAAKALQRQGEPLQMQGRQDRAGLQQVR